MPRKRLLAPGFFRNELLAECSPLARLLFAGMWCWADREGRLEDRPRRLKADILPYDNEPDGDTLLGELTQRGFVDRYEADGKRVIQIVNFGLYQDPHPRETPSILPPKTEGAPKASLGSAQGASEVVPSNACPSCPSSPSSPSQPSSPSLSVSQRSNGLELTRLTDFRKKLGDALHLGRAVSLGKNGAAAEYFQTQLAVVPESALIADCCELAKQSTRGIPSSLAWFVPWLKRLPEAKI